MSTMEIIRFGNELTTLMLSNSHSTSVLEYSLSNKLKWLNTMKHPPPTALLEWQISRPSNDYLYNALRTNPRCSAFYNSFKALKLFAYPTPYLAHI